jgi:uncharacterized damage-inducible protein DinB
MNPLIETWLISSQMNELLLYGIKEESFTDRSLNKGRSVGEQFAHIQNVRLMWLKVATPEIYDATQKIEKDLIITKQLLLQRLDESNKAIVKLLEIGFAAGRIKGFKPHPEAFVGYLIAHEAHHRGQIILNLKENGHIPDKKILYGLWEWGAKL